MLDRVRLIAIMLAAVLQASIAFGACAQIEGMRLPELDPQLVNLRELRNPGVVRHVEPLRNVYARISSVAGIRPALVVCEDGKLNAIAEGGPQEGLIVFFLPMLELLDANIDEIAAVMGHEFSHLLLDHFSLDTTAQSTLARWAQAIARERYRQSGNADSARQFASAWENIEIMRYSRALEREADDKGFSLAVTLAKFNADGFKRFAAKISKISASSGPRYLASHPGWLERLEKAEFLARNQTYTDSARALLSNNNWAELKSLVKGWLGQIPESGAAWYYQGRILARTSGNRSRITKAFEEAASLYLDNKVLGVRSQEDQDEADAVWFSLCLGLFDEGYKFESANCSKRLRTEEAREKFRVSTFRGLLIVGGSDQGAGNLLVARDRNGVKLITNDPSIAAGLGAYNTVSPVWRAIRYPEGLPR